MSETGVGFKDMQVGQVAPGTYSKGRWKWLAKGVMLLSIRRCQQEQVLHVAFRRMDPNVVVDTDMRRMVKNGYPESVLTRDVGNVL